MTRGYIILIFLIIEEKLLHEEVELKYDELQSIVQDIKLIEQIQIVIPVRVSHNIIIFIEMKSFENRLDNYLF
jgi:hypothetical protein